MPEKEFLTLILYASKTSENVFLFFFISTFVFFGVCICMHYLWFREKLGFKQKIELIKRRSKVHQKNRSGEHCLNLDERKALSENFKPKRVWWWFVYKIIENNCCWRLFAEFIQTQKRHPTSFDKGESREPFPCEISHICPCGFKNQQREARHTLTKISTEILDIKMVVNLDNYNALYLG